MRRWIAIAWHASFLVLAAALYVLFVLPRWFELTGAWPVGLGRPLRIVDGVLIGLAALPIAFTYLHTRKPEFGTPQLALTLRLWSIVLHVAAGVLIVGAAVAEFWVSLDAGGQWLFGIYGAAGALAVLGALGFNLAYLAELPPPPPKPLKAKVNRRRRDAEEDIEEDVQEADEEPVRTDPDADDTEKANDAADATDADDTTEKANEAPPVVVSTIEDDGTPDADGAAAPPATEDAGQERKLGARRFLRRRGGVAVDE